MKKKRRAHCPTAGGNEDGSMDTTPHVNRGPDIKKVKGDAPCAKSKRRTGKRGGGENPSPQRPAR